MPAYFDISLQFPRTELHPGFLAEFDAALERAGLKFRAGYWEDAGLSQAEIAAWNQKKLESNFVLGMKTHVSQDYKQTLYEFKGYQEVRSFWINQHPEEGVFSCFIIIPEDEVLTFEGSDLFQQARAAELLELAQKLWQFPAVKAIQTGLEFSDGPVGLNALRAGVTPCVEPFAILEQSCYPSDAVQTVALTQGRPGLLFLSDLRIRFDF